MVMLADGMASRNVKKGPSKPSPTQPKRSQTGGTFAMEGMGNYNSQTKQYAQPGTPSKVTPAPKPKAPAVGRSAAPVYGGGNLGTSATGVVAEMPAPQPMNDADWWNQDAGFQSEQGSLKTALQSALDNLKQQRTNYDADFAGTLKNLGWGWDGASSGSVDGFDKGAFDQSNQLGAYGQGMTNMNNDFNSRGLGDSSFFADALTNFNTDMKNQFDSLSTGRGNFMNEYGENTGQGLSANNEYQAALNRAKQLSLGRRDAQYGIG